MNDTCRHIEDLLPAFVERALGTDDSARVRAHLEACNTCRASLSMFESLEASLVSRRAEVPPVDRYLPAFVRAREAARVSPPLVRALRALTSIPGVAIVLAMWAGMLVFNFRVPIGEALSRSTPERFTGGLEQFANLLVALTNGDVWMLIGVFSVVALAVVASMGAMTLRYLRH